MRYKKPELFRRKCNGFTLAELLVGLLVTSIVLAAATTLAFALGSVDDYLGDTARKQAQLRYATLKVSDLIKNCKLICRLEENNLAIWCGDYNADGQINLNEMAYLGSDLSGNYLRLCTIFDDNRVVPIGEIKPFISGFSDYGISTYRETYLIPQCRNLQFLVDTGPPWTKFATISFDLEEDGNLHNYQISAAMRCHAGNVLNPSGAINPDDD